MPTAIGVFNDRDKAEGAIDFLVNQGVEPESLGVIWRERTVRETEEIDVTVYVDHFENAPVEARKGALGGAVGGGVAGIGAVLLGSAGVVISGPVGALLAAGTVTAAAIAGAAGSLGGSVTGGVLGAVLGATDREASKLTTTESRIVEAIERDGFVVTVETEDESLSNALAALKGAGADSISQLRSTGALRTVVELEDE